MTSTTLAEIINDAEVDIKQSAVEVERDIRERGHMSEYWIDITKRYIFHPVGIELLDERHSELLPEIIRATGRDYARIVATIKKILDIPNISLAMDGIKGLLYKANENRQLGINLPLPDETPEIIEKVERKIEEGLAELTKKERHEEANDWGRRLNEFRAYVEQHSYRVKG